MTNPCYDLKLKQDCPRRHAGCAATCPEWADYEKKKHEEYELRKVQYSGKFDKDTHFLKEQIRQRRRKRR